MPEKLLSTSDNKLIQYLNEAFGKEKELETALQAHIKMASGRAAYKKRLQDHLKETKTQARNLERRIKKIGGKAEWVSLPGPDVAAEVASKATAAATKALAAAKGPVHALRGTGEAEKLLKNAKTELWNEYEEIGNYIAIEALAKAVGDKETEKLARDHRKQEERMAAFLTKQLPQLTKAVVTEEIPASERRKPASRRTLRRARRRRAGRPELAFRDPVEAVELALLDPAKPSSSGSRAKSSSTRTKPAGSRAKSASSTRAKSSSSRSPPLDVASHHQPLTLHRSQVVLTWLRRSAAQQQPGDDPADGVPHDRRDAPVDGLLRLVGIEREEAVEGAGEETRRVAHELHDVVGPVGLEQHQHDPEDEDRMSATAVAARITKRAIDALATAALWYRFVRAIPISFPLGCDSGAAYPVTRPATRPGGA